MRFQIEKYSYRIIYNSPNNTCFFGILKKQSFTELRTQSEMEFVFAITNTY